MVKKNKFHINIFIILEKTKPIIYTSKSIYNNNYIIYINNNNYYCLNSVFKHELFYNNSFLVEISCIDNLKYNTIQWLNNSRIYLYNVYYFYFIKCRVITISNFNNKLEILSIDKIYKNSNWMERECFEMFGINFINKSDSRNLLLDYSRIEHPLLKDFPCEGYYDVYYNFFEDKLDYFKSEYIELY